MSIKELNKYCKLYAKRVVIKRGVLVGLMRE